MFPSLVKLANSSLNEPVVVRNAFDNSFLSVSDVMEALRSATSSKILEASRPRLYIDDKLHPENFSYLVSGRPTENESVDMWVDRHFGNQEFLLAINALESSFPHIADKIHAHFISQYPETVFCDPCFRGIDLVLLIGRYKDSPWKIHNDEDRISIVHFQLQGLKQLDFPESEVKSVEIGPGDALSFPGLLNHLGHAGELSVSLSLGVSRFRATDFFQEVFRHFSEDLSLEYYESGFLPLAPETQLRSFLSSRAGLNPDKIELIGQELSLIRKSNNFFLSPKVFRKPQLAKYFGQRFCLKNGERIFVHQSVSRIVAAVRGRYFILNPSGLPLIERINEAQEVSVENFSQQMKFLYFLDGLDVLEIKKGS